MELQQALAQLETLQKKMYAYHHAMGLVNYDAVTTAPSDTAEGRGVCLSILAGESYRLLVNEGTKALLDTLLEHEGELDANVRRQAELLRREYTQTEKIPVDEYMAYTLLLNDADAVWHKAKEENDFAAFAPYLERIVAFNQKMAAWYAPEKPAYDVLLDLYEEGLTQEVADAFFAALREKLVPLVRRIAQMPQIDDSMLYGHFPVEQQRKFSDHLMDVLCLDRSHCGIGETEHPFSTNFNKKDVRITTKYHENSAANSMFSVIHEAGHALYELGSGDEYEYTCVAGGVSMGIHESQSRLYENMIGRSRAFIDLVFPEYCKLFPEQSRGVTAEAFYRAVNKTQPSLIRISSDELTYAFHIMVRYEIEKQLIAGNLQVADLPRVWNEKMHEYLGIEVPNDRDGVLQDSHWSGGMIGYFPSYALGSAYAAQIVAVMERELSLEQTIRSGNLQPIADWLEDHIFRFGKALSPAALLEQCCGEKFDAAYYIDYLERKYSALYGLE